MKFAYADPPYIGTAKRRYDTEEVDHKELLLRLNNNYDGWALSSHVPGLWDLIPMIPREWKCRIAVWCKPNTRHNCNYPIYAWEPLIFKNGRNKRQAIKDYMVLPLNIQSTKEKHNIFIGKKPDEFCYWLFELLGMTADDEFDDLFPGTGRVTRAWETWKDAGIALFL